MKDPLRGITKMELHQHNQRLIAEKEALLGENSQLKNDRKLIVYQVNAAILADNQGDHIAQLVALSRIRRLAGG